MVKPFGKPAPDDQISYRVEEGGDIIPDGQYEMKLVAITKGVSDAGNDMFIWDFIITNGKHAGKDFRMWTALTQAAMWKFTEVLEALGFDATPGQDNTFSKKEAIGRLVMGNVITDEFVPKKGRNAGKKQKRSSLDSLDAHPKGAGYKPKGSTGSPFPTPPATEEEEDEEEEQVEPTEGEDEELEEDDEETEGEDEEEEDEDSEDEDDEEGEEGDEDEVEEEEEEEEVRPAKKGSSKRPAPPAPPAPRKTTPPSKKATR